MGRIEWRARDRMRGGTAARDEGSQGEIGGRELYSAAIRNGRCSKGRRSGGRGPGNVPFEFVGEVASAGAVAEARDVERGATAARHGAVMLWCLFGAVIRDLQLRQVVDGVGGGGDVQKQG